MKLNENNANFAVVRTAFHHGGAISFHNSLNAAIDSDIKNTSKYCTCGCCGIVPITDEARKEMLAFRDRNGHPVWDNEEMPLYSELPEFIDNGEHYSKLCR